MTRALALQLCRKEFPQRWKVVKSVFIRRKESTVCVDRHRKRLRGRVPETRYPGILNHLHGAFLLVFLWPIILICLVHGLYLVYLRTLPHAHMHLLAKVILLERHIKRTSLGLTLLWPTRSLSVCVVREVSWLREWEIGGLGGAQPPPLIVLLFSSWSFNPQGMNLQSLYSRVGEAHLPPDTGLITIFGFLTKVFGRAHMESHC